MVVYNQKLLTMEVICNEKSRHVGIHWYEVFRNISSVVTISLFELTKNEATSEF